MYCQCSNQPESLHLLQPTCSPSGQSSSSQPSTSSAGPSTSGPSTSGPSTSAASAPTPDASKQLTQEQMNVIQDKIQEIFAAKGQPVDTSNISNLFSSMTAMETKKKTRVKIYANGYFMTYDKISSGNERQFWRCEFKNSCNARVHTNPARTRVINKIHTHNHPPVSEEEIRLFGLDPRTLVEDVVYIVENTADSNQRRRIRKRLAEEQKAKDALEKKKQQEQQQQQEQKPEALLTPVTTASVTTPAHDYSITHHPLAQFSVPEQPSTSGPSTSQPSTSTSLQVVPELSAFSAPAPKVPKMAPTLPTPLPVPLPTPISIAAPKAMMKIPFPIPQIAPASLSGSSSDFSDSSLEANNPQFKSTFDMAQKLSKALKGGPSRVPRLIADPMVNAPLRFFIAQDDGAEEHLYMPMSIEARDEGLLKSALEVFCGKKLSGNLVFEVSAKIKVMVNQQLLRQWDNEQFFLIDTSKPNQWLLKYVDDKAI